MFEPGELKRYSRHLILSEFGEKNQMKLKDAKVLMIGAGGLGCPVLQYLASAGVGTLGIVDDDVVDETNLPRQILFTAEDTGMLKVIAAFDKLTRLNPLIKIIPYAVRLNEQNAIDLFMDYDIIVDGSDNFATRYLVNDACILTGKSFVSGAVYKFEGQVTVCNYKNSGSYRCLFPEPPSAAEMPSCADIGVLSILPGIIGTLQAAEVIKLITGLGEPLAGKLLTYDALGGNFYTYSYPKEEKNFKIRSLEGTEYSCYNEAPEITAEELKYLIYTKVPLQLIDVRDQKEFEAFNIGGLNAPLKDLSLHAGSFNKQAPTIVYCENGQRSQAAAQLFIRDFDFSDVKSLKGGIYQFQRL